MTRVNKGGKKGGKPYLVCTVAKARGGCDVRRKVRLDQVEEAILEKADEFLATLPAPDAELQMRMGTAHAARGRGER